MKLNFKTLKLLFKPSLVKQALKNLWEIVEYNLDEKAFPGVTEVIEMCIQKQGASETVRLCFHWIVYDVLPIWSKELTEGHALHLSEINWNDEYEE